MDDKLKVDKEGVDVHVRITWLSIIEFLLKEWRTIGLLLVLLGHAGWTHIGQKNQDKEIQLLKQDNSDLKQIIKCLGQKNECKGFK